MYRAHDQPLEVPAYVHSLSIWTTNLQQYSAIVSANLGDSAAHPLCPPDSLMYPHTSVEPNHNITTRALKC